MNIILKENEWAENAVKEKELGQKPSETLRLVARYYIDKGYSKKDVRKLLCSFLIASDPLAPLTKWSKTLDYALSRAQKKQAVNIDYIPVTKTEMERIDSLDGVQIRRLAFTLLCLAKYWGIVSGDNSGWVNNKDNEIMAMANISTSLKRQCMMFGKLKDLGLIGFSRKIDNTNVRVCFMDDGEEVLRISDFRNLGYQYLKYHGEPFFECENCGLITRISNPGNGRKQKYCKDCAVAIKIQQTVNSVMKQRNVDFS